MKAAESNLPKRPSLCKNPAARSAFYGRQRHWRRCNVRSAHAQQLAASGGRRECLPCLHKIHIYIYIYCVIRQPIYLVTLCLEECGSRGHVLCHYAAYLL